MDVNIEERAIGISCYQALPYFHTWSYSTEYDEKKVMKALQKRKVTLSAISIRL